MNQPKVSVVIPIYNVEKYLRQCLDSVVAQTLKEIEIICVNDGSKDSSLEIINEYAAKDERIVVIDKPNGGYGQSMNCGFDKATGEYVGIIESDDYADLDMFEKLYACAKEFDLDVVKSGFYYYYSIPEERSIANPIASKVTAGRTFCPTSDFDSKLEQVDFFNIKPTIWSAIYRKQFILDNDIRFHETPGASYQDASFNFKVWTCAKRVRLMKECFLHYRQDNEASSINSPGKVYCICDEYEEMERFLLRHPLEKGILDPVLARIRFDSYNWNYSRLSEPLQAEFIHRFQEDFQKLNEKSLLRKAYFEWYKWSALQQILKDPDAYHQKRQLEKQGIFEKKENKQKGFVRRKLGDIKWKLKAGYHYFRERGFKCTVLKVMDKVTRRLKK